MPTKIVKTCVQISSPCQLSPCYGVLHITQSMATKSERRLTQDVPFCRGDAYTPAFLATFPRTRLCAPRPPLRCTLANSLLSGQFCPPLPAHPQYIILEASHVMLWGCHRQAHKNKPISPHSIFWLVCVTRAVPRTLVCQRN